MRKHLRLLLLPLVQMALLATCGTERPTAVGEQFAEPLFHSFTGSGWSEPVNLGPPVNVAGVKDGNPAISVDGLALYFDSDRTDPGGQGATDMWASRRACTDVLDPRCAWQTPVNLGPVVNSPYVDGSLELSDDGHLLFFLSHKTRDDCSLEPVEPDPTRPCDEDLYVSWRPDPNDDRGWRGPVRLGPEVNTVDHEGEADFLRNAEPGQGNLYFVRRRGVLTNSDIYSARIRITRNGSPSGIDVQVLAPAVPVQGLDRAGVIEHGPTVRADGRELFFFSRGVGLDLWTATRRSPKEPWSERVNVGIPMNSSMNDLTPALSHDGRTMYFTSNRHARQPGLAGWDIYMSTRTPSGR